MTTKDQDAVEATSILEEGKQAMRRYGALRAFVLRHSPAFTEFGDGEKTVDEWVDEGCPLEAGRTPESLLTALLH